MLDIFYNEIIPEVLTGKVDCYMFYNMVFNIDLEGIKYISNVDNENLIIPTLVIRNKKEFDSLLTEYLAKALEFYDTDSFCEEIQNDFHMKAKTVMTLLFSNATMEDFENPCSYLRRRIDFFDNKLDDKEFNSEILKSTVSATIKKGQINMETPYKLETTLINEDDKAILPTIYFGISKDTAYIYSIQNKIVKDKSTFDKIVNRLLYKVNDGFDTKKDTYEEYGIGNLKDITPSFLYTANILLSMLKQYGINHIEVPSFLVERWNAKELYISYKEAKLRDVPDKIELITELRNEHERIQSNLTEKLLRVFRRLDFHHTGVSVKYLPFDPESSMVLDITEEDECSNPLLNETFKSNKMVR